MCEECTRRVEQILGLDRLSQKELDEAEKARKEELAELRSKAQYRYSKTEPTAEELHWFQMFSDHPGRIAPVLALLELRVEPDPDKPFLIGEPDFPHMLVSQLNAETAKCIDNFQWYVDVAASQRDNPVFQAQSHQSHSNPGFKIFELFPDRPSHKPTDEDTTTTDA